MGNGDVVQRSAVAGGAEEIPVSAFPLAGARPRAKVAVLPQMRAIAAGFGLPQLGGLTLPEVITHVVRSHEQRTRTTVTLQISDLPIQASVPIKIAIYRFIQEGLQNSYRHAGGKFQADTLPCDFCLFYRVRYAVGGMKEFLC
jgi:hypothetical protein